MKKQEPDPAIFYALHDANVASETALRRAGYSAGTPRAVASMKHNYSRAAIPAYQPAMAPTIRPSKPSRRASEPNGTA